MNNLNDKVLDILVCEKCNEDIDYIINLEEQKIFTAETGNKITKEKSAIDLAFEYIDILVLIDYEFRFKKKPNSNKIKTLKLKLMEISSNKNFDSRVLKKWINQNPDCNQTFKK